MSSKRAMNSFYIRSAIPGNMVVSPDRITLPQRSVRTSMSQEGAAHARSLVDVMCFKSEHPRAEEDFGNAEPREVSY